MFSAHFFVTIDIGIFDYKRTFFLIFFTSHKKIMWQQISYSYHNTYYNSNFFLRVKQAELTYQAEHLKQTIATTKMNMLEKREAEEKAFSEEVSFFHRFKKHFTVFFTFSRSVSNDAIHSQDVFLLLLFFAVFCFGLACFDLFRWIFHTPASPTHTLLFVRQHRRARTWTLWFLMYSNVVMTFNSITIG